MADDASDRGPQDRTRVSGQQSYEVSYLSYKHQITMQQARDLIRKHGGNRAMLDNEAAKLRLFRR